MHRPLLPCFRDLTAVAIFLALVACPAFAAPDGAGSGKEAPHATAGKDHEKSGKKKVVFLAGKPSHGFAQHEHNAGCLLLAKCLNENVPNVETEVFKNGQWPETGVLEGADAIVIYCDGGGGHLALPHLDQFHALMDKGVGLGCIHYAVEVPKDKGGPEFLKWIGGYFETNWSINPVWDADFLAQHIAEHPVSKGVHSFATHDEWYYHMRFREGMEGVVPILSAVPPDSTRQGKDDAHGGNPAVRAGIGKEIPETVIWVAQRPTPSDPNGGRGFGCTGGHYHFNWAQDDFRKTVLNAIVWIAHGEIPDEGVPSKRPTVDDLLANQDKKVPADFDKQAMQKKLDEMNPQSPAVKSHAAEAK